MTAESTGRAGSQRPLRVVYLNLQGTSPGQGSYTHVTEIVRGLRTLGYRVRLLEPQYGNGANRPGALGRIVRIAFTQLRFVGALPGADVAYIRFHFAALPAVLVATLVGKPVVQEVNGPYDDLFLAWPRLRALEGMLVGTMRAQLRLARSVIVVTDRLRRWVGCEAGRQDAVIIANAADTARFKPVPGEFRLDARPRVTFVGVLAPWQGIDEILRAASDPAWPTGVRLTIAGTGPMSGRVREAADKNPLVEYLGLIPHDAVPALLNASVAALCIQSAIPRNVTGGVSPLKLFEAMASGTPVIAADLPGIAEVVTSAGCGLLVAPNDPPAIAAAVAKLYRRPDMAQALGERGRAAAVAHHSWDARAASTARVLRDAVGPRA